LQTDQRARRGHTKKILREGIEKDEPGSLKSRSGIAKKRRRSTKAFKEDLKLTEGEGEVGRSPMCKTKEGEKSRFHLTGWAQEKERKGWEIGRFVNPTFVGELKKRGGKKQNGGKKVNGGNRVGYGRLY